MCMCMLESVSCRALSFFLCVPTHLPVSHVSFLKSSFPSFRASRVTQHTPTHVQTGTAVSMYVSHTAFVLPPFVSCSSRSSSFLPLFFSPFYFCSSLPRSATGTLVSRAMQRHAHAVVFFCLFVSVHANRQAEACGLCTSCADCGVCGGSIEKLLSSLCYPYYYVFFFLCFPLVEYESWCGGIFQEQMEEASTYNRTNTHTHMQQHTHTYTQKEKNIKKSDED